MELTFIHRYEGLSDKEIVERIITDPYDEEAATYLIYNRYEILCKTICMTTLNGVHNLDALQSELFMLLKGKRQDWHVLRSFQWRSQLSTWLKITAYNLSLDLRKSLIENNGNNTSLDKRWDDEDLNHHVVDIPFSEEKRIERRYDMMVLNEAIHLLDNTDQRFVLIKRLQGYSSKEVAMTLHEYWKENGIVRYNSKKQVVIPDSGYIDNLFKRGYDKVKAIYKSLDRCQI